MSMKIEQLKAAYSLKIYLAKVYYEDGNYKKAAENNKLASQIAIKINEAMK